MDAYISNIKLVKLKNDNCYIKVTFVDETGNKIACLDNSKINDDINFRTLMFGILSSCNCFDFLRLGGDNPNFIDVSILESDNNKIKALINKENKIFTLLSRSYGILSLDYTHPNMESAKIESINSSSGTLSIILKSKYFSTFYISGNLYYGFGYPLNMVSDNKDDLSSICHLYRTFIESILEFYNTDDLLKLGRNNNITFPKVIVKLDNLGNIVAIGNDKCNFYLNISNTAYEIKEGSILSIKENEVLKGPRKILYNIIGRNK